MLPSENKAQIAGYAGEFRRSFMCFAVQCSVAEVDGSGRIQDCNGDGERAGVSKGGGGTCKSSIIAVDLRLDSGYSY